jgi:hypothetical protein
MIVRMIGCMRDLNSDNFYENYILYDAFIANLDAENNADFIDVSVYVDGAAPAISALGGASNRNGYQSKQMSFNRTFKFNTRELSNFIPEDIAIMQRLDYLHTFPYHYFTFWDKIYNEDLEEYEFICNHKSELGKIYFSSVKGGIFSLDEYPGFVVVTFDAPSIKSTYADKDSKSGASRQYSFTATEWGVRNLNDIILEV